MYKAVNKVYFKTLDEIVEKASSNKVKKKMAVVAAVDDHTLDAVKETAEEGFIEPILIGPKAKVEEVVNLIGGINAEYSIIDIEDESAMAQKAVDLVREGEADFMMKGLINTIYLLRPVLNDTELNKGGMISHVTFMEIPEYHKLVAITDSALNINPDLNGKKAIIQNAVRAFEGLGYENPKVAVLCANEEVSPKQTETVDASELQKMNEEGILTGCEVCGPISFDLAMQKDAAELKGYTNSVAGDPDILLCPNLVAGNILAKSLRIFGHASTAGVLVGAKCPIVLLSRSNSMKNKKYSIIVSALMS